MTWGLGFVIRATADMFGQARIKISCVSSLYDDSSAVKSGLACTSRSINLILLTSACRQQQSAYNSCCSLHHSSLCQWQPKSEHRTALPLCFTEAVSLHVVKERHRLCLSITSLYLTWITRGSFAKRCLSRSSNMVIIIYFITYLHSYVLSYKSTIL